MKLRYAAVNWGKQSDAERSPQDREASPHGIILQGVDVIEATSHTFTRGRGVIERSPHTVSHGTASIEQRPYTFTLGTDSIEPSVKDG